MRDTVVDAELVAGLDGSSILPTSTRAHPLWWANGTPRDRHRPLLVAAVLAIASAAAAAPALVIEPPQVAQGGIALARASFGVPIDALHARLGARPLPVHPLLTAGDFLIVLPVDVECPPGALELTVLGRDPAGEERRLEARLPVVAGRFRLERLRVQERMVHPPQSELARIRREEALLAALWPRITPIQFHGPFQMPVHGEISSSFGRRRVLNGVPRSPHAGTDIRAPEGQAVHAPQSGTIALGREFFFMGKAVILDHGLGMYTIHAHLSRIDVAEGQRVAQGQRLGAVGHTGRATGPHLHWGAKIAGARVDPVHLTRLPLP